MNDVVRMRLVQWPSCLQQDVFGFVHREPVTADIDVQRDELTLLEGLLVLHECSRARRSQRVCRIASAARTLSPTVVAATSMKTRL